MADLPQSMIPCGDSSILYQSEDASIVLLDIPRSLEESQSLPGLPPPRRILSSEPAAMPFNTPEPKDDDASFYAPTAAQVADLMTAITAQSALQELAKSHQGPYCLPRVVAAPVSRLQVAAGHHLPPFAEPFHGTIESLRQRFLDVAPKFDLILLDPPWPNRSARRKSESYPTPMTLPQMRRLLSLVPVRAHLQSDGLVAIWITNKPSIRDFLSSPTGLLFSWGLELVTEWVWVKVAANGEPLYAVDSKWRKPWERLLIARRVGSRAALEVKPKVIVATPDVHSRKPCVRGLFGQVFGREDFTGLEVFARNLTAGWWSWGDEVFRFQAGSEWVDQANEGAALWINDLA